MRHHHWLLAAVVLLGLWMWSKRVDNPDTTPPAPASQPATQPAPQAPGPVGTPSGPADTAPQPAAATGRTGTAAYPAFIPPEAHPVLEAIARGGPYHYRQDGNVFQNRERRLPAQPRGYYHEFTVDTPGSDDRGARRIVTGGNPPVEYWYTDDHYRTFRRFEPNGAAR